MDYKEMYEEALERASGFHKAFVSGQNYAAVDIKTSYESIFPELKEPEDEGERIRKALLDFFTHFTTNTFEYYENISNAEVAAWLKSLRPQPKQEWSEEDEKCLGIAILALSHPYDCDGKYDREHAINWFKSLKQRIGENEL